MLRTAQAQSEEEQLRHALEASCSTAAAASAEADMLRQAIAESMAASAGGSAAEAGTDDAGGGAVATAVAADDGDARAKLGHPGAMDEEEQVKRALAISGLAISGGEGEWEKPAAGVVAGGGSAVGQEHQQQQQLQLQLQLLQGFDAQEFDEDPELREAIKASLAGE